MMNIQRGSDLLSKMNKDYISPSRIWTFYTNKTAFIQNYVFDFPAPTKRNWETGTMAQDLLYTVLKGDPIECCKNKREHEALKKQGIFGIYGFLIPLKAEIEAMIQFYFTADERRCMRFETKLVCHKEKTQGFSDILTNLQILDVKASTGDLDGFTRNQSPVRRGFQEVIYTASFKDPKPRMGFLTLECVYPYRVQMKHLPDEWVVDCRALFQIVKKKYWEFMDQLNEAISDIRPDWFRNKLNCLERKEIYKRLVEYKDINGRSPFIKTEVVEEIPYYVRQKMDIALGYN